ncbi:MAG: inosine/xanthosine triphosphatase [Parcubacteria group bacterium]|nr:inosine/xanthosine triphosphatase [Parcubacteria group bacterium]
MKIKIASRNQVKVEALKEIIQDYPHLRNAEIIAVDVSSEVDNQPKSLEETIKGAINRSRNAYSNCNYSFGIESGLMVVPYTKTGHMNVCVCAIFDGKEYHLGLSSAWEAPKKVAEYMLNEGLDMNDAAHRACLTQNPKIGSAEGLVGIMTKGRLTRKKYTKEAIRTALIHVDTE